MGRLFEGRVVVAEHAHAKVRFMLYRPGCGVDELETVDPDRVYGLFEAVAFSASSLGLRLEGWGLRVDG